VCLMLVCHGVTYRVCADLSAKENVTPRQVSEVTIASHTQRVSHKPGIMSEEMTIYVAAIDATAATIGGGGGGTQQGSEEGKNQSLRKEKRRCTIRRPRCTYPIFVCGHFFTRSTPITLFCTDCRKNRRGPLLVLQRAQCAAVLCIIADVWHA